MPAPISSGWDNTHYVPSCINNYNAIRTYLKLRTQRHNGLGACFIIVLLPRRNNINWTFPLPTLWVLKNVTLLRPEPYRTYTPDRTTLKTLIKLQTGDKKPIITESWAVYCHDFFCLRIQDPYILHILQAAHVQPVSLLQLLLSNTYYLYWQQLYERKLR